MKKGEKVKLSRTDLLAIDRTKLANERTFLAYFRTFIVFISSGIAIIKLSVLEEIAFVGYLLLIVGPGIFLVGLFRFLYVKRRMKRYYYNFDE
jgi:putative membrane protein